MRGAARGGGVRVAPVASSGSAAAAAEPGSSSAEEAGGSGASAGATADGSARGGTITPLVKGIMIGVRGLKPPSILALDKELEPLLVKIGDASSTELAIAATQELVITALWEILHPSSTTTAATAPDPTFVSECRHQLSFMHPSVIAPFVNKALPPTLAVLLGRIEIEGEHVNDALTATSGSTSTAAAALRGGAAHVGTGSVVFNTGMRYSEVVEHLWHGGCITWPVSADERNASLCVLGLLIAAAGARGKSIAHMAHMLGRDEGVTLKFPLLQGHAAAAMASCGFMPRGWRRKGRLVDGKAAVVVEGTPHLSSVGLASGKNKASALLNMLHAMCVSVDMEANYMGCVEAARDALRKPHQSPFGRIVELGLNDEAAACLLFEGDLNEVDAMVMKAVAGGLLAATPGADAMLRELVAAVKDYAVPLEGAPPFYRNMVGLMSASFTQVSSMEELLELAKKDAGPLAEVVQAFAAVEAQVAATCKAMHKEETVFSLIECGNVYYAAVVRKETGATIKCYGGSAGQAGETCAGGFNKRWQARVKIMVGEESPSSSDGLSTHLWEIAQLKKEHEYELRVHFVSFKVPAGELQALGGAHGPMLFAEAQLILELLNRPTCLNVRAAAFTLNGRFSSEDASAAGASLPASPRSL